MDTADRRLTEPPDVERKRALAASRPTR